MSPPTLQDYKECILRVLVHVQNHLDDALSLEELARVACFSPYHFHRIFRGMVGEPCRVGTAHQLTALGIPSWRPWRLGG